MIYNFDYYRDYLQDELSERKKVNSLYSLGSFARDLKLSKSFLSLILNGSRNLSEEKALVISEQLFHSSMEREYFLLLVNCNNAKKNIDKKIYLNQLADFRKEHDITPLSLKTFEVISDLNYSALHELVTFKDIDQQIPYFAKYLNLSEKKIEEMLNTLVDLKMVALENGKWVRLSGQHVKTPYGIKSAALQRFHREAILRGAQALAAQEPKDRCISGVTLSANTAQLAVAKEAIQEFTKKMAVIMEQGEPDACYQLEVMLFDLKI